MSQGRPGKRRQQRPRRPTPAARPVGERPPERSPVAPPVGSTRSQSQTVLLVLGILALLGAIGGAAWFAGAGRSPTLRSGILYADGERIWLVAPDTAAGERAARRELLSVSGKGSVTDPAWSPDGTQIAYSFTPVPAAGATYGSDIYIMDADGSGPRAVFTHDADGGLARAPAWTPDGASLYFSYSFSRPAAAGAPPAIVQQIERLDLKTGGRAVVAPDGDLPSLSPDGARLAYVKLGPEPERKSSLWLAAADGSGARPLVPEGQFTSLWAPRFARDGATIFFTASGGDRSNPRLKVAPLRPSGQGWPAAVSAHGFPMDIWLVDPASGRLELLAALAADDLAIVPSPDGSRLALSSGAGLFFLDLASGSTTMRSPIPSFGSLDWRAQ